MMLVPPGGDDQQRVEHDHRRTLKDHGGARGVRNGIELDHSCVEVNRDVR